MRKESELLSQNNSNLKKVILIDEETLKALMEGKRVEGAIRKTQDGLVFKAYKRQRCGSYQPDTILYQAGCGHLKESKQRYKMWLSVPKAMGMNRAAILLADQSTEITDYLYDRGNKVEGGLIEFV